MTTIKESKSAATIRRKRTRGSPGETASPLKVLLDESLSSGDDDGVEFVCEPIIAPPVIQQIFTSEKTLFLGLVAFRFVNALMIQTSYVPDEYWQSVEVAHQMVFGYGYETWEWKQGIRGYSYPLLFAVCYKVLAIFRLDTRLLLIKVPRLVQGVLAAVGDLYLYKLSQRLQSPLVARWTLLCQLTSWFTFYCATRTLTNSIEAVLTTVALYYFPWPGKARKSQWKYLSLVGLAIIMRPTAAIVWLPLVLWHFWMYRTLLCKILALTAEIGFVLVSISSIIDQVFYGKWVNVQYNFLEFNVLKNMGAFYGTHPWHWYISQGFAVIMGSHLFPFLLAMRKTMEKPLLLVILWTVSVYSILAHKEFRFLFPILPLAMHICGCYLHSICDNIEEDKQQENIEETSIDSHLSADSTSAPDPGSSSKGHDTVNLRNIGSVKSKRFIVMFLIITNLPLGLYMCLLHQRGTVDVMGYLHENSLKQQHRNMSVMFLMPCHSTPYYSYLHRNITMQFLTCEPNIHNIPNYVDEAGIFYRDPEKWLIQEYIASHEYKPLPTHIVMFNGLHSQVSSFLTKYSYTHCARFFHTHVPEGRVGSHVLVLCQSGMVKKEKSTD